MYSFGDRSRRELRTCHPRIQAVLREAIKHYDFSVIKGERGEVEQQRAVANGASKVNFPDSYHNRRDDETDGVFAVDIVPYPIDWENTQRFHELAEVIKTACKTVGEKDLEWGYDMWKWDLPHWQITKARKKTIIKRKKKS